VTTEQEAAEAAVDELEQEFNRKLVMVVNDDPDRFELHIGWNRKPRHQGFMQKVLTGSRKELSMTTTPQDKTDPSRSASDPAREETSGDPTPNPYIAADVKPLAFDIVMRGSRRLRRWFLKGGSKGVEAATAVGPKIATGMLVVVNLAALYMLGYISIQFIGFMMVANPTLLYTLLIVFAFQLTSGGFLWRQLKGWVSAQQAGPVEQAL
jgi:hypothetical protein